ncbi:MAG: quinol monooxygenase YgiN [Pseudohongiellaceae bacterium]|jgi:quinol monooxygenase YgiN
MILIIGSVTVREDSQIEALRHSQAHVSRSRAEPGCLSHEVTIDADNPNRLLFVERWETMEDLERHFQVQESSDFVAAIALLATVGPDMQLYESTEIRKH